MGDYFDDMNGSSASISGSSSSPSPSPNQTKAYGIGSMVCGILSLLCCCCNEYFTLIIGVVAIILFVLERVFVKKTSGFAIAGLICAIISVIISLLSIALLMSGALDTYLEQFSDILGEYESLGENGMFQFWLIKRNNSRNT